MSKPHLPRSRAWQATMPAMNQRMQRWLIVAAAGVAAVTAGGAIAVPANAAKAAQQRIEAQAKAEKRACRRSEGDARALCELKAKGRERIAKAELAARLRPGPEAEQEVKEVRADAEYELAKKRCRMGPERAEDACVDRAKAAREAAIRLAKVEKVEDVNAEKAKAKEPQARRPQTPAQRYASGKARCNLMGTERDSCLADLNRRFNKT